MSTSTTPGDSAPIDQPAPAARLRAFVVREWLPLLSLAGLAATSLYAGRLPSFSASELQVLLLLMALFVAVRGLEASGLFAHIAARLDGGRHLAVKLVAATFFLSMLLTNDVALVVMVPLTLIFGMPRKDLLVALEAIAANAGSALTPFGNPQNLFIYWYYGVSPERFLAVIAPLSAAFLLVLAALAARLDGPAAGRGAPPAPPVARSVYASAAMLVLAVLVVLRLAPLPAVLLVLVYAAAFNRPSLRVDYGLLLTFLLFFGIAENMKAIVDPGPVDGLRLFALSAVTSQVISNVPTALLFAKLTDDWPALLWGVNVGAFGGLVGSLANLIAYRLLVNHYPPRSAARFTVTFIAMNYAAFVFGAAVYALAGRYLAA